METSRAESVILNNSGQSSGNSTVLEQFSILTVKDNLEQVKNCQVKHSIVIVDKLSHVLMIIGKRH